MEEDEKDIALCTQLIEKNSNNDVAYRNRGAAFIYIDEIEKGLNDLNKALEINPSYDNIYQRGWNYITIGRHAEAIRDFSKLIEIDPVRYDSFYSRGWAYITSGDFQNAILDFSQLIKLYPQHYDPY